MARMINEFRSWLRLGEGRDSLIFREHGPPAERQRPLCYVIDEEPDSARMLTAMLQGSGVDTQVFTSGDAFADGLTVRMPDAVFVDVSSDTDSAIDTLFSLGERAFKGPVQLMGCRVTQVVDTVRRMGERRALKMLPPLRKPVDMAALRRVLDEHRLAGEPLPAQKIELAEALRNDWIEFWYQPKIDLVRKRIAGLETFARVRHPQFGTLPPGAFVPGADEASLTRLSELALTHSLGTAAGLARLGINLRVAVNISTAALSSLPMAEMVRDLGPKQASWPGLILDVTAAQIVPDVGFIRAVGERLAPTDIKLAIDDFGRGQLSLAHLRELSFAELKLDRNFVTDCGTDRARADVCKAVIDLAHNFGSIAVAIGVEKPADMRALQGMGCDLGQGFLFGQPMPEEALFALLRQRAARAG